MENGSGCTRVLNGAQLGFAAGKISRNGLHVSCEESPVFSLVFKILKTLLKGIQ